MERLKKSPVASQKTKQALLPGDAKLQVDLRAVGSLADVLPLSEITDRRLLAVRDYWEKLRGDGIGPRRQELDPIEMWDTLPNLTLIDVLSEEAGLDFRYRLAGTAVCAIHGMELKGRRVTEIGPPEFGRSLCILLHHMVKTRQPQLTRWQFRSQQGYERAFEVLRLPLSDDGEEVDGLLVAANFDVTAQQLRDYISPIKRGAA